jgi:hypothetical protein
MSERGARSRRKIVAEKDSPLGAPPSHQSNWKINLDKLEDDGEWLYFLSPDGVFLARLSLVDEYDGLWFKELFWLKPPIIQGRQGPPRMAHSRRAVHSEPGYLLPDAYIKAWKQIGPERALELVGATDGA